MANNNQRIVRGFGLHEKLKEHKPTTLIAYDQDDEQVKVNVPDVRNRHARALQALTDIPWVRVDLLDKKGGLLHRHLRCADDREPAGELEEIGRGVSSQLAGNLAQLVQVMLRAQEMVLIRHQQATQQILDAQNKILDTAVKRLEIQEVQYEHAMRLNHALSGDLVNAQLAQLQLAPPEHVDDEGNARPASMSDKALAAFLPAFMRAAMGQQPDKPTPTGKPGKTNGVNPQTKTERPAPSSSSPTE